MREHGRLPLLATRIVGVLSFGGAVVFFLACIDMVHSGWGAEEVFLFVPLILALVSNGIYCLVCRRGLPVSWGSFFRESREELDCLGEEMPPEEQLEHLEILLEQGVISQEEYEKKRNQILKEL